MDLLTHIKQLVIRRRIGWTVQALEQMLFDGLTREDVIESIVNARRLLLKRSTSPGRRARREKVCIIRGMSYSGFMIYTKGAIRKSRIGEVFYVMISAKRSEGGAG